MGVCVYSYFYKQKNKSSSFRILFSLDSSDGGQLLNLFEPIYKYLFTDGVQDIVRMISIYGSFRGIDPFCVLTKEEKAGYKLEGYVDGDEGEM